jgi:hypothetical protein
MAVVSAIVMPLYNYPSLLISSSVFNVFNYTKEFIIPYSPGSEAQSITGLD